MGEASAYAPGHLTGFFKICTEAEDPLRKGARGAGVSISQGVTTRVRAKEAERPEHAIRINGRVIEGAIVSENVLGRMLASVDEPMAVWVDHDIKIPPGAGFGSSGSGALTLALALNEVLGLELSKIEAAQVAHLAELECGTGLGSVFAAFVGGFGALVEAGGPGYGRSVRYDRSEELSVAYLHFGPMPTKEALGDPGLRRKINEFGGRFVDEFSRDITPSRFMELSRRFTEHVGITTPRLRSVLDAADNAGVPCTMAMFGEVLFSLVSRDEAEGITDFYRRAAPGHEVNALPVDDVGARVT